MPSGGGNQQPTTTQRTTNEMGPEQRAIFNVAFPYAQRYASKPLEQFAGTGIAGFSPEENAARATLRDSVAPQIAGQAAQAAGTQAKLLDPDFMLNPANNPYIRNATDAITGQVTRNLNENILPQVRSGAIQSGGMYSGGASKAGIAEAGAIGKTNTALSDTIADQYFKTYQQGLGQLQQAVSANPGVMAQQLVAPDVVSAVGAQERAMRQAQLDEEIRKFYTGQALPLVQSQELMRLIQGMPGGSTVSTATGSVPHANPMMSTLGGAASGAAIGSMVPVPGAGILGALIGGGAGYFGSR